MLTNEGAYQIYVLDGDDVGCVEFEDLRMLEAVSRLHEAKKQFHEAQCTIALLAGKKEEFEEILDRL